jgi:Serine/Threonine/Tyrosine Kinase found in polyvalent proteins
MLCASTSNERLCWRTWPCPACSRGITPIGYLVGGYQTGKVVRSNVVEEVAKQEADRLKQWVANCSHTTQVCVELPKISEGSEHIVYLDQGDTSVVKTTKPGIFGESYYLVNGAINQRNCSPLDYLIRLRLWKKVFGSAPVALGITDLGQIVTKHKFIAGKPPEQAIVDDFLIKAGLEPVKQKFWLWKKSYPIDEFEIGVGDARADNFVIGDSGIVPIDLRLWFA